MQLAAVHEFDPREHRRLTGNCPCTDLPWRGRAEGAQTLDGERGGQACSRDGGQRQRKSRHLTVHERNAVIPYPRTKDEGDAGNEHRQRPQAVWAITSAENECGGEGEPGTKQDTKNWKVKVQHARLRGEAWKQCYARNIIRSECSR